MREPYPFGDGLSLARRAEVKSPKVRAIDTLGEAAPDIPPAWTAECLNHLRLPNNTEPPPDLPLTLKTAYLAVQNALHRQLLTRDYHDIITPNGSTTIPLSGNPVVITDDLPVTINFWEYLGEQRGDSGKIDSAHYRIDDYNRLIIAPQYARGYELRADYYAGIYTDLNDVPEDIRHGIYATAAHYYEHKGDFAGQTTRNGIPAVAHNLIQRHIRPTSPIG